MSRICVEEACKTRASFNNEGQKGGFFCKKHKKNNMINVMNPICIEEGCRINPCFNFEGESKGLYCKTHADKEMVNVKESTCKEELCYIRPSFNFKGEKKGIFCFFHKKEGMVNLYGKTCNKNGCKIEPCFNYEGETKGLYCKTHADKEMVNVKDPTCKEELCYIQPSFNFKGETIGLYCLSHKKKDMTDVKHKRCNSCDLFRVLKENNYLCSYCAPESSKRQKTKELQIAKFLTENSIKFINNKQFQNDCCLKYRPDFLVECHTYYLIIEVDENAHRSYEKECEIIRMNNISSAIGLPVKFIRYNPDNKDYKKKEKENLLLETIKNNSKFEYIEDILPIYLFY
jgi:hypothetical protein